MEWPTKYSSISKNTYSNGDYCIVPIRYEDRLAIMQWRNEQIYHLRQDRPLTSKDQDKYFSRVVKSLFTEDQPVQYLFSYLESGRCIGYGGLVHINWKDKNAEISFLMDTKIEAEYFEKHWGVFLELIERFAFNELELHKIYTYAFDLRTNLYEIFEKFGYCLEARLSEHCLFQGAYIDIVIHSKINTNHL